MKKVNIFFTIDSLPIEWNISSLYFLIINAAWHGGNQPVALLRCNEAQVALITAFRSSALLGLVSLIFHLLTIRPANVKISIYINNFVYLCGQR